jgi:hypothetical protein
MQARHKPAQLQLLLDLHVETGDKKDADRGGGGTLVGLRWQARHKAAQLQLLLDLHVETGNKKDAD